MASNRATRCSGPRRPGLRCRGLRRNALHPFDGVRESGRMRFADWCSGRPSARWLRRAAALQCRPAGVACSGQNFRSARTRARYQSIARVAWPHGAARRRQRVRKHRACCRRCRGCPRRPTAVSNSSGPAISLDTFSKATALSSTTSRGRPFSHAWRRRARRSALNAPPTVDSRLFVATRPISAGKICDATMEHDDHRPHPRHRRLRFRRNVDRHPCRTDRGARCPLARRHL